MRPPSSNDASTKLVPRLGVVSPLVVWLILPGCGPSASRGVVASAKTDGAASFPTMDARVGGGSVRDAALDTLAAIVAPKDAASLIGSEYDAVAATPDAVAPDVAARAPDVATQAREAGTVAPDAAARITVDAAAEEAPASGLRATYYRSIDLTAGSISRIDAKIDFDWGSGTPNPNLPLDNFSARWEGQLKASESGRYRFYSLSDDGFRLWIDGTLVIDDWRLQSGTQLAESRDVPLEAGRLYALRAEYFEATYTASVHLYWKPPGAERQVVPEAALVQPPRSLGEP